MTYSTTHVGGAGTADNIFLLPADANNFPTHEAIPLHNQNSKVYNVAFASAVNLDDKLMQWKATYDNLPYGITMTYLGGYDAIQYFHTTPTTGLDTGDPNIPATVELLTEQDPRTHNEELRFSSAPDQRITWQAGAYYFHSRVDNQNTYFRDYSTPSAPDFVSFPYDQQQKSQAGYGQAYAHFGDLTVSAGLRYTRDLVSQVDKLSPDDGIFPALQSASFSKWTWHAGADWNPTQKNLLYAKVDTGYRAGAFNLFVPADPTLPTIIEPYKPEAVTAYEIGSKNRFLDDRLSLNADAFYMNYNGEQLPESNQGGSITINAQSTKIYGVEAQGVAALDSVGRVDANVTYLHARFGHQLFTTALGQTYDIGGHELTQSPSLSATLGVEHAWTMPDGKLTARLESKYQAGQYFDFYNFPDSFQKAYTNSTAHLLLDSQDGRWEMDLFVRNIENSLVIVDESESYSPPVTMPGTYNVGFQAPRTYGVRLRATF